MYVLPDHGTYKIQNRDLDLLGMLHFVVGQVIPSVLKEYTIIHLQDQAAQEAFGFSLDCLILENKDTLILQNV